MAKKVNEEQVFVPATEEHAETESVPVKPVETQYNRYNMTLPRSFSIYNEEGSVIYRGEVESVATSLKREVFEQTSENEKKEEPVVVEEETSKKKEKKSQKKEEKTYEKIAGTYDKKRAFFLVVPMILFAVILAAAILGAFDTKALAYVSGSKHVWAVDTHFGLLDPAIGFLTNTFDKLTVLEPATSFFKTFDVQSTTAFAVQGYVLVATTVIYMVFALIGLISSICGLASKRKENGAYKKTKLGFLSIVMFVCAIGILLCTALCAGVNIKDILTCFTGDGFTFGYGAYALIGIPVLTFICTLFSFRKVK